ncbi:hypothetical protein GLYMA_18G181900v4 [Glycine max]|nr:hypothetical protein JHK86_050706 [Glycine max]KAH1155026.1 hypothetical protein GYH30_050359 [Glycine max]KRG99956.2 hypothetical protein GLYMA_18G181900v4 [Glycine max]
MYMKMSHIKIRRSYPLPSLSTPLLKTVLLHHIVAFSFKLGTHPDETNLFPKIAALWEKLIGQQVFKGRDRGSNSTKQFWRIQRKKRERVREEWWHVLVPKTSPSYLPTLSSCHREIHNYPPQPPHADAKNRWSLNNNHQTL